MDTSISEGTHYSRGDFYLEIRLVRELVNESADSELVGAGGRLGGGDAIDGLNTGRGDSGCRASRQRLNGT